MQEVDFKKRVRIAMLEQRYQVSEYDEAVLELYQRYLQLKKDQVTFNPEIIRKQIYDDFLTSGFSDYRTFFEESSGYIWGLKPKRKSSEKILKGINKNVEPIFIEDTFLRSVVNVAQRESLSADKMYYMISCGYTIDDLTNYVDVKYPSRLESTINSDFEIPPGEIDRCRKLIKKLRESKLSKYNNQPIYQPKFGRDGVKKVLVIDQSYKDYSILRGGADDSTFEKMLDCAIKENPDADILIKTHPDAVGDLSSKPKCYYQKVEQHDNVYKITDFINPISMIEYVDKVYVCSSQFGFEALMCGKEVHTFGLPFYANWGLTIDDQKCSRRTRTRTLEELFYFAYIMFSFYINPQTNKPCEIEEAIDYLIELREEYFKEEQVRCEI